MNLQRLLSSITSTQARISFVFLAWLGAVLIHIFLASWAAVTNVHRLRLILGATFDGAVIVVLSLAFLRMVLRERRMIAELNHLIRGELHKIVLCAHVHMDKKENAIILESANNISKFLRRITPEETLPHGSRPSRR